jgi:hypothetical protein
MLAVIEHHKQPPLPQVRHQRFVDRLIAPFLHPHRSRQRVRQQIRPLELGQLDQPHTIRELAREPATRTQREPALADSTRAGQRDRTRDRQQALDLRKLATPTDETAQFTRQVARSPLLHLCSHVPANRR